MPKLTPEQAARKWAERTRAATPDYQAGIERVTVSPAQKAAENFEKLRVRLLQALQDGTMENALRAVTLERWKAATLTKGVQRFAAGVDAGQGKQQAFMAEFFPFLDTIKSELDRMPDVTLQDGIARAVHQMTRAAEFKKTRP